MHRKHVVLSLLCALALCAMGFAAINPGGIAGAQGPLPRQRASALGSGFSYQGQLKKSGTPVSAACGMTFSLWDAPSGPNQVGGDQVVNPVTVTNGLFTVLLDGGGQFGANAFDGNARWLQIAAQCPGDGGPVTLTRQPLSASPYALYSVGNWGLNGNAGTTSANALGTTDSMTLTLEVSGMPAVRLVPNGGAPIIIGGYSGNSVNGLFRDGATIGGGGSAVYGANVISGTNVTWSTIGGGVNNRIVGGAFQATIGGGYSNTASSQYGTLSGGYLNAAGGYATTVGGGYSNTANGYADTVSGGFGNTASDDYSTVSGGFGNTASGYYSTVSGGKTNTANSPHSVVSGGGINTASGYASTVSGGQVNIASGSFSTVGGGAYNIAQGNYSFAAGNRARAVQYGTFVWADTTAQAISSTTPNQFLVRATGGISLVTSVDGSGNPSGELSVTGPGNAAQSLASGGLVKAMVHYYLGSIADCYNSQASPPSSSAPCGFATVGSGGIITVSFPFTVDNRFVSVTPHYDPDTPIIATVAFPSATQVKVRTFGIGGALASSAFYLEVH